MGIGTVAKRAVGILSGINEATPPGQMVARIHPGVGSPPAFGVLDLLHASTRQPWLRAITSKIAYSIAATSWKLYAVQGADGKARGDGAVKRIQRSKQPLERRTLLKAATQEATLVEITDHPFLTLMHTGNAYLSGNALSRVTQIHLDTVGEAFWLKERDGSGAIIGLWPIPPHWVRLTPIPQRKSYLVSFRGWQGEIPDTEIFWQLDPDPENPYSRGRGIAQAITDELEIDYWGGRYLKAWFYNGARPELVITGTGLNPSDTERLEERWSSKAQGFMNAYKPMFLNAKVDIQTIDTNFRNMQLVQLRQAERDTIIQIFGLPPELLGIVESSNRASIVMAKELYGGEVLVPRLELRRDAMQAKLLPEWDERLILDYASPNEADREFDLSVMKAQPGAFTVDDWRDAAGRGPLPDNAGNTLLISTLTTPTDPSQLPKDTATQAPTLPAGDVSGSSSATAHRPAELRSPKDSPG